MFSLEPASATKGHLQTPQTCPSSIQGVLNRESLDPSCLSSVQSRSESPGGGERRRTAHCLEEKPTPSPRHPPRPRTAATHGGPASCHRCSLSTDQLRKCGEAERGWTLKPRGSLAANQTDASGLQLGHEGGRIAELLCAPSPPFLGSREAPPGARVGPHRPCQPGERLAAQRSRTAPAGPERAASHSPRWAKRSPPPRPRHLPPERAASCRRDGRGRSASPRGALTSRALRAALDLSAGRIIPSRQAAGWLTGYATGFGGGSPSSSLRSGLRALPPASAGWAGGCALMAAPPWGGVRPKRRRRRWRLGSSARRWPRQARPGLRRATGLVG